MGVGGTPKFGFSQKDPGFERFRSILDDPQNLSKKYYVSSEKENELFFFSKNNNSYWHRKELLGDPKLNLDSAGHLSGGTQYPASKISIYLENL